MKRRFSASMRTVLRNLRDGLPVHHGLTAIGLQPVSSASPVTSVLTALRKRGLVEMRAADASYKITPQGIAALAEHERTTQ